MKQNDHEGVDLGQPGHLILFSSIGSKILRTAVLHMQKVSTTLEIKNLFVVVVPNLHWKKAMPH